MLKIRSWSLWLLFSLLTTTLAHQNEYSPFLNPQSNLRDNPLLTIWKRQSCPSSYTQCSNLNANNDCCPPNTSCSRDAAGNVACCPFNAVCTGIIGGTIAGSATTNTATSTSGFVLGGTTTSNTTSFQSPSTSTATSTATTTAPIITGSTVPNGQYPFIYIPTSYTNAVACSSAWTFCQQESTSCLNSLAGQNGVTIAGLGSGTTVQGSSGTVLASASSICSVLSTSACYNLQLQQCSSFGTSNGGGGVSTTTVGVSATNTLVAAGARRTPCAGVVYAVGAGAAVGAAGVLL